MAHPLDDENLLRVFSRFLATAEVVRLAAASRTWRNTFRGYFNNPVQPLRYWSRIEGATRSRRLRLAHAAHAAAAAAAGAADAAAAAAAGAAAAGGVAAAAAAAAGAAAAPADAGAQGVAASWQEAFSMPEAEAAQPDAQNAQAAEPQEDVNEDEDEGEDANVDGEEEQPQQQGPPRPVLRLRRVAARLGRELAAPAHFTQQQLLHLAEEALGMQVTEAVTRELSSPDWSQSATAGSFWGMLLLLLFHAAPSGGSGPARLLRKLWAASVSTSVEEATEAPTQHAGSQQAAGAAGAAGLVLDRCVLREFVCAVLVLLRYEEVSGMLAPLGYGEPYAVLHGAVLETYLHLEALEQQTATRSMQAVPEWRESGLPYPASRVTLPGGGCLTPEQVTIIQGVLPFAAGVGRNNIVYPDEMPNVVHRVIAFAGCAKTTTLKSVAQAHLERRFLYAAFNKATADTAGREFPVNTVCKTTHSLAYREMIADGGPLFRRKEKLGTPSLPQIKCALRDHFRALGVQGAGPSTYEADVVNTALHNFMTSSDEEVGPDHVSAASADVVQRLSATQRRPDARTDKYLRLGLPYLQLARRLWGQLIDPRETFLPLPHNAYLKAWALGRPIIRHITGRLYDAILIDEAQDINEVTLGLLMRQPCVKVLVGDPYQHIYSFNNAANTLADGHWTVQDMYGAQLGRTMTLSASFRLGPEVAGVSNMILQRVHNEQRRIMGCGRQGAAVYTPWFPPEDGAAAEDAPQQYLEALGMQEGGIIMEMPMGVAEDEQEQEEEEPQPPPQQQQQVAPGRYDRVDITGVLAPLPPQHDHDVAAPAAAPAAPVNGAAAAAAAGQLPDRVGMLQLRVPALVRRIINGHVVLEEGFKLQPLAQLPPGPDGRMPPLLLICRRNDTWFKVAVALMDHARAAGQPAPRLYLAAVTEGAWGGRGGNRYSGCELFQRIEDLWQYRFGDRQASKFKNYESWEAIQSSTANEAEIMAAVSLVSSYGERVQELLQDVWRARVQVRAQAHYILSTAHKMKGLEEEWVQLAEDFATLPEHGPSHFRPQQKDVEEMDEVNLVYVAASRTLTGLILSEDLAKLVAGVSAKKRGLTAEARSFAQLREAALRDNHAFNGHLPMEHDFRCHICGQQFRVVPDAAVDVVVANGREMQDRGNMVCGGCSRRSVLADVAALTA